MLRPVTYIAAVLAGAALTFAFQPARRAALEIFGIAQHGHPITRIVLVFAAAGGAVLLLAVHRLTWLYLVRGVAAADLLRRFLPRDR